MFSRTEYTKAVEEAGEEVKASITTNSLSLPLTKSALQEILTTKVEQKMQTPEKATLIQQRMQQELQNMQLTIPQA